jgi:hypothetical protein
LIKLRNKAKELESFCLVQDESNDKRYLSVLITGGVTESSEVVEELGSNKITHGTTGKDLFFSVKS